MSKINDIKLRSYLEAELDETGTDVTDAGTDVSADTSATNVSDATPAPLKETTEETNGPQYKHGQKVKFMVEGTIKKVYDMAQAGEYTYLVSVKERKGEHEYLVTERGVKLVEPK